jgi:hypothetical protein
VESLHLTIWALVSLALAWIFHGLVPSPANGGTLGALQESTLVHESLLATLRVWALLTYRHFDLLDWL